jgi:hypothetical protein
MRNKLMQLCLAIGVAVAQMQPFAHATEVTAKSDAVDYFDANGRLIGTTMTIAGATYLTGPDGEPVGVIETVDGRRVFKAR